MVLQFVKVNPTQNMTILVTSPVPRAAQPEAAAKLMAYDSVFAEQVGFVESASLPGARARLQMMGGEFCGNASMSLAAMLASQGNLPDGEVCEIPLEVSGAKGIVACSVARSGDSFRAEVAMPLPRSVETFEFGPGVRYPAVRFDGITHVIVPEAELSPEAAERVLPDWIAQTGGEALGILLTDADLRRMRPLVGVRATGTRVWERGCASGTAALGAYAAMQARESVSFRVAQPGGEIGVSATFSDGKIVVLSISGTVRIAVSGEAYL